MIRRKTLTFGIVFLVWLCSFAVSQQQPLADLVTAINEARNKLYHPGDEDNDIPKGAYTVYSDAFDVLEGMIKSVKDDLKALYDINLTQTSSKDAVIKVKKSVELSEEIKTALAEVEKHREKVEDLWLDAYDAWQVYHNAVAAYNSHPHVSPRQRLDVEGLYKFVATSLYSCHGPCDYPFETDSLAQVSHQAYCSEKHGTSGTTNIIYWTCFGRTTCDRLNEHWKECRATNCSVLFPPPEHEHDYDYYDHKVKCEKSVYSLIPGKICGKKYFTCEHSTCPKSNTHIPDSTSSPVVSPTPTPTPTDSTPNCPDCTSDCSSPCSCTNSGTCGGTVVDNTPDCSHCTDGCSACPPQMVACGGASYTGCSGASSRTEHRVESCSNCNNSYWTCSQYAYRHTDEATCRRPGCGVTFYRCNNGTCTSNWGTRSSHWAQ